MTGERRLVDFLSYCFRIVWDKKKGRGEHFLAFLVLSISFRLPTLFLVVGRRLLYSVMIVFL